MAEGKRAVSTFQTTIKGTEHLVHAGDVFPATDPIVKARPELFEPVEGDLVGAHDKVPKRRTRKTT
jgi:hypothetical protein